MGKKSEEENLTQNEEFDTGSDETVESGVTEDETEVASDEEAAPDFEAEAERNKDLYLRALADLENYRKRAQREKEDAIRFANGNLLREMIPVIDNLERAVEHAGESEGQDQGLLEGVVMTLEQFRKVLEGFGVKIVASLGEAFNPEFHQAMGEMVTADYPPNTVAQELQKGYTLNSRLLRPALVMIAKAPEQENEETDNSEGPETEDGSGAS